ncbi:MAG: hypothetical protein JNM13_01290 [Hyphomicrobiaceae bacterium]|nr:hypothetical protein [Hyphomicrobiaceae bacterium]
MRCLVKLIGHFRVFDPTGRDVTPKSRKACCILSYLLLNDTGRETRAKLATLLWSDSDDERARASLRQSLKDLRAVEDACGPLLTIEKNSIALLPGAFDTDLRQLDQAIERGSGTALTALLPRSEFSLAADLVECDPLFDNWLWIRRSAWSESTVARLVALLEAPQLGADHKITVARAILQLDPYCERAVRVQMLTLNESAGAMSALAYFESYRRQLRQEYEVEPTDELIGFAEQLRPRPQATALPAVVAPAPSERSRAGLPTIAIGERVWPTRKSNNDHILAAFATELAATLSRFRDWTVFQTPPAYAPTPAHAATWARRQAKEGVEFVLLVGATEAGERATTFSAICMSCPTGDVIFEREFIVEPTNWRRVFNDVSSQLASRLCDEVSYARLHHIAGRALVEATAYDHWLEGQRLLTMWRPETEDAAIRCFERAIEIAPDFARAYASLAGVYNSRWIVLPGWKDATQERGRALDLAAQAVRLDHQDHRNQVTLGWSHLMLRRWDCAAFHFSLAHDLNPSNPGTLIAYALASSFMGDHDDAMRLAKRAFELQHQREAFFFGYLASIAFFAGDFAASIEAIRQAPDIFPDIQGWTAAALALNGDLDAAGRAAQTFLDEVRGRWCGETEPTDEALAEWFKDVFPLRRAEDRKLLSDGLDLALSARFRKSIAI